MAARFILPATTGASLRAAASPTAIAEEGETEVLDRLLHAPHAPHPDFELVEFPLESATTEPEDARPAGRRATPGE